MGYEPPQFADILMSQTRKTNIRSSLIRIAADVALNIFVVLESPMI